jgi:uncharacterized phosphosugar-binding protein
VNAVLVEAAALAAARGVRVAVLRSANLENGDDELERSIEPYRDRVPAFGKTGNPD